MGIQLFDMDTPLTAGDSREQDVMAISRLWRQIGDDNTEAIQDSPQDLRAIMAGLDYLVLRDDSASQILGAVSILKCTRKLAKLDSLAVDPIEHRKGYGRQLAISAITHCAITGYKDIVTTAMPSSQQLFLSVGFRPFEEHESGNVTMFYDFDDHIS